MADIFLSYAREDLERIRPLVAVLEGQGWSVFWDRRTPAGRRWDEYIDAQLQASRCVVAWSTNAIDSHWVREEAHYGLERQALVPLRLEIVTPPFGFRQIQAADLCDWAGTHEHAGLALLLASVDAVIPRPVVVATPSQIESVAEAAAITKPAADTNTDIAPGTVFRDRLSDGSEGPEMVVIQAGRLRQEVSMGAFTLGRYTVTFEEYDAFARADHRELPDPNEWGRGRQPGINVSWSDAKAYAAWLSEMTSKTYRLPSEAEWEYAVGADQARARSWRGKALYAVVNVPRVEPVGTKEPNDFGLFDMLGNVWEWVEDRWRHHDSDMPWELQPLRVVRGGSWSNFPSGVWRTPRGGNTPDLRYADVGFRLARTLEE